MPIKRLWPGSANPEDIGRFIHILPVIALVVPVRVVMRAEKTRTLPLPSIVGGIVLLVVAKKKG